MNGVGGATGACQGVKSAVGAWAWARLKRWQLALTSRAPSVGSLCPSVQCATELYAVLIFHLSVLAKDAVIAWLMSGEQT